jgi:hypothetical protein
MIHGIWWRLQPFLALPEFADGSHFEMVIASAGSWHQMWTCTVAFLAGPFVPGTGGEFH